MKECDNFRGFKTYSGPSYIFSRGQDPNLPGCCRCCQNFMIVRNVETSLCFDTAGWGKGIQPRNMVPFEKTWPDPEWPGKSGPVKRKLVLVSVFRDYIQSYAASVH